MRKIVLISCVSKKKNCVAKAEDLYQSALFKGALKYAKAMNADRIYILSALHGLLELHQKIAPYNKTLNTMKAKERKEWSEKVIRQLIEERLDLEQDIFIFLAGKKYREYLAEEIGKVQVPMEGLTIGKQLKFLKENT